MKKMKQIISLILVLAMILNLNFSPVSIFAEDGTAVVENKTAEESAEVNEKQNEPDKDVAGESGTESEKSDSTSETTEGTETKPADSVVEKATEKQAGEDTEKNAENGETKETAEETLEEDALPLGGPAFRKVNREAEDITAKINKSRPDVYRITETNDRYDIIKDGVVVDNPYELSSGHKVEFYYRWNIPHESMKGLQEGDFFYIDLPEFKFLTLFGIKPNEKHPITTLDNEDETLGFFQVETGAKNRAKLTLNETAVKKYEIRDGYLMLRFRAHVNETLKFVPSSETAEGIIITEVPKSNNNKLIGNWAHRPNTDIYKTGAAYDDSSDNKTKIEWNIYVNYKNLPNSLAGNPVEEKKNVWVEDDLNGTNMKIDKSTVRIYTAIYVPVNEKAPANQQNSILSTDAVYWPSRQPHFFENPLDGETYEEYKTRFQNSFNTLEPLTAAIYPRATGDAILYYLGDLSGDKAISYSDLLPQGNLETRAVERLNAYLKNGKITQKQLDGAKKLYGIDGDLNTKMKKMVAFHLRFASIRDKSGLVKNTATVNWHKSSVSHHTGLFYSVGAAGAGYNEVTAVGVTKNWARKEGGPVTMILKDATDKKAKTEVDRIKLGVTNPNPAQKETDKWTFNFNDLPKYKKVVENGKAVPKVIVYEVEEMMSDEDKANYTSKLVDDNDDTQFTYLNTNDEKIKIRVNKQWLPQGQIPQGVDGIAVNVVETETGEVVLRDQHIYAAESWTKEFTVPKYNMEKKLASYTVEEVTKTNGYQSEVEVNPVDNSVTIYNIPTITVDVTKTWVGKTAARATFYLKRVDSGQVVDTLTLTGADGWKGSFKPQPKHEKNGDLITYDVEEEPIAGYHSLVVSLDADSYQATNTEFINVEVIKKWHTDNPAEITPVQVELYFKGENGKADVKVPNVAPKTLAAQNGAKVVFENVPLKDENGKDYVYTVKELNAPAGYEVLVETTPNHAVAGTKSLTVYNIKKTDITVRKIWKGPRTEITLILKRDNAEIKREVVTGDLNAKEWSHSFTGLAMYDKSGHKYVYTVEEADLPNYDKKVEGSAENGFTVTNTNNERIDAIVAKKVWVDDNDATKKRPASITFVLEGVAGTDVVTYEKTLNQSNAVAGNANEWQVRFEDLRKYSEKTGELFTYSLKEVKVKGYESAISGNAQNGFTVTNTKLTNIKVKKVWYPAVPQGKTVTIKVTTTDAGQVSSKTYTLDGVEDQFEKPAWNLTINDLPAYNKAGTKLVYAVEEVSVDGFISYKSGDEAAGYIFTNTETHEIEVTKNWVGPREPSITSVKVQLYRQITGGQKETVGGEVEIFANKGWKHTFTGLAKTDINGKEYQYSVDEVQVPNGYAKDVNGFTITNKNVTERSIKVKKVWVDDNDAVGKRPQSITINLKANGEQKDMVALPKNGVWEHTFTGLRQYDDNGDPIKYTVEEVVVSNYNTAISGQDVANGVLGNEVTITNTIEGKVSIPVSKNWIGPKASVTVNLLADNVKVDSIELKESNNWQHTFTGKPEYKDGKKIIYTVEEVTPNGYVQTSKTGSVEAGFVFTNRNEATTKLEVEKKWVGPATEKVVVKLLADGQDTGKTVELNVGNSWKSEFTGLRKYHETDGHEIVYTVEEVAMPNYAPKYDNSVAGKVTITNTNTEKIEVPIEKKWLGDNAASATIHLWRKSAKDADALVGSITLRGTETEPWKHTFQGLDKYSKTTGKLYEYYLKEDAIDGYHTSIVGFVVTNRNDAKINIPVKKVWVNSSISEVTVRLWNGDIQVGELKLNEGNKWMGSFDDLRKFDPTTGAEIKYTLTEDAVPNFSTQITGDKERGFVVTNTYIPPLDPYYPPGGDGEDDPVPPTPDDKPNPPTTTDEIPGEPTPQGDPNKPTPPTPTIPSVPEEEVPTDPIPEGKTELPKTDGIPAGAMHVFGLAMAAIGLLLKKKK